MTAGRLDACAPTSDLRTRLRSQLATAWLHLAAVISGLILGLLGPFGTFTTLSLTGSLVFWVAICWLNTVQVTLILSALVSPGREYVPRQDIRNSILASRIAAVPCAVEVWLLLSLLGDSTVPTGWALLGLYGQCLLITLVLTVVFELLTRAKWQAEDAHRSAQPSANTPAAARFAERIPARIDGTLLSVSAEDHYLDIVTDQGQALVAGRFGTALTELGTDAGLQIHRSHWVAIVAIARVHREAGKTRVELTDGRQLPVSRKHAPALKALGW